MRSLIALAAVAVLAGCATGEYKAYADAHAAAAHARAQADAARYAALADIARNGDSAAKVAAAVTLAVQGQPQAPGIAAPKSWQEIALGWAGVVMPSLTQMYASNRNAVLGVAQSNNSAAVAVSTNNTIGGIAARIQAPGQVTNITGSYNVDNTHPAQVVTQPAPIVVQPSPVVTGP